MRNGYFLQFLFPENRSAANQTFFPLEIDLKDGAHYCYCASRDIYSGFLWVVPTNTGIFLRGLKLCRESRT